MEEIPEKNKKESLELFYQNCVHIVLGIYRFLLDFLTRQSILLPYVSWLLRNL